jgi:hypothetical protein
MRRPGVSRKTLRIERAEIAVSSKRPDHHVFADWHATRSSRGSRGFL